MEWMITKRAWIAAGSATLIAVGALAFPNDRMESRLGGLGSQLVRVVGLIGVVYTDISKNSVQELAKDRDKIVNEVTKDLRDSMVAIEGFIKALDAKKSFEIDKLETNKRIMFLALFPAEQQGEINKENRVTMAQMLVVFVSIRSNIEHNTTPFLQILNAIKSGEEAAVADTLGVTRNSLVLSLAALVTFSATLQDIAYR
jgi:hypothetical protein